MRIMCGMNSILISMWEYHSARQTVCRQVQIGCDQFNIMFILYMIRPWDGYSKSISWWLNVKQKQMKNKHHWDLIVMREVTLIHTSYSVFMFVMNWLKITALMSVHQWLKWVFMYFTPQITKVPCYFCTYT